MEVERAYGEGYEIMFHDAIYFTIVTVSSVGYGEFSPQSAPAKIIVMIMVIVALVFVGDQLGQLMRFLSMHCQYASARYSKKKHTSHIIVSGMFNYNSMTDFLGEMFHLDHGDEALQVDTHLYSLSHTLTHTLSHMYILILSHSLGRRTAIALNALDFVFVYSCHFSFVSRLW